MGIDMKYGQVTVERTRRVPIGKDEPVFVLRAQDPLAPDAIDGYADDCERAGCPEEHIAAIRIAAERMRSWQVDHPGLVRPLPGLTH